MSTNQHQTAVLFFSRSAKVDAGHKSKLKLGYFGDSTSFIRQMQKHTMSVLQKLRLPVFHIDETLQRGNSFGQRISNATQDIFDSGYDSVIVVGNDCLELDHLNWTEIIQKLQSGQQIMGPTYRSGAYLMGINKDSFNKRVFSDLPWQSLQLKAALLQYLSRKNKVHVLKTLRDINFVSDFFRIIRGKLTSEISKVFLSLLNANIIFSTCSLSLIKGEFTNEQFLRGPPVIVVKF